MQNTGFKIVINIILTLFSSVILYGQVPDTLAVPGEKLSEDPPAFDFDRDSALIRRPLSPSIEPGRDTSFVLSDSIANDTVRKGDVSESINDIVDYDALDSLKFAMDSGTVKMYNQAIITYGDIKLEAGYIYYNMKTYEVTAHGIPDSTGKIVQKPVFTEKNDSYTANEFRYNFKTQKAFIREVKTEQEGGWLHSTETKKQKNGHIHMKDGKYTTCDADHPHFYIAITKGISMPGDKIVAGPAYLVLEDIPLPIGLPFGFFPNSRTKTSGILIPQYGEENSRGFYLRDGGYYFAMNDYMDLRVTGDIYSNGTWGVRTASNYRLRYKFNGTVNLQFFNNITGYRNIDVEGWGDVQKTYSINWTHAQAREASPNSSFRASVNLSSSQYDRLNTQSIPNIVTNTKQSSISYTRSFPNSPFNLSASLNHTQNSRTQEVNMKLPKVSLNMNRITPFERKKRVGPKKWYENIQLSYSSILENRVNTTDTSLFVPSEWENKRFGYQHDVPLSLNVKPFKKVAALQSMTITPNVSYTGRIYTQQTGRYVTYDTTEVDGVTVYEPTVNDTIYENRLSYAHAYLPRISAGLSPKIYGMYGFTGNGRLKAIRHVITTSANFSYVPDMTALQPDYYRDVWDTINNQLLETYGIYDDQLYGTPTYNGASGSLSLSLRNNIEAKMESKNDTIEELQKVKILDNLSFSSSYNVFNRDSLAPSWSTINMSGNTRLFKNKVSLTFRSVMDPFGYSETRSRVNETYFAQSGKLLRITNASLSMGVSFKSKSGEKGDDEMGEDGGLEEVDPLMKGGFDNTGINDPNSGYIPSRDDHYTDYTDFDVPWNLKLDYTLSYRKPKDVTTIVQTLRASGDLSLTPKWKIQFSTGYDIVKKSFTMTNFSLRRDLHCWQMSINVVPFGSYRSYNFQINAKSSILSDLKYNKRKSWMDNF